jgi:hypothetical protein
VGRTAEQALVADEAAGHDEGLLICVRQNDKEKKVNPRAPLKPAKSRDWWSDINRCRHSSRRRMQRSLREGDS